MDRALSAAELSRPVARAIAATSVSEAEIAFIRALWFWIPAALTLWSALVWTLIRVI